MTKQKHNMINSEDDSDHWRKKVEKSYFYVIMAEIKWVTPIATATAIAESEWKRELAPGQTRVGHVSDNCKEWNALWTITQKAKENKKG